MARPLAGSSMIKYRNMRAASGRLYTVSSATTPTLAAEQAVSDERQPPPQPRRRAVVSSRTGPAFERGVAAALRVLLGELDDHHAARLRAPTAAQNKANASSVRQPRR